MNIITAHPSLATNEIGVTSPYGPRLRAGRPLPVDSVPAMDAAARKRRPGARLVHKVSSDKGILRVYRIEPDPRKISVAEVPND